LRDSVDLALAAVSRGMDPAELRSFLQAQLDVAEIYDLHIWAISTTETALTVHLVRPAAALEDGLPARLRQDLHERFKIAYARSRSRLASLARGRRPTRLAQP
jgi:cobalt-zinc-cadmium efflux system protein